MSPAAEYGRALLLLLLFAGCGPRLAVRPSIAPRLDESVRRKIYDDYALHYTGHVHALHLPLMMFGMPRWERADGRYRPEQMENLWDDIPRSASIGDGSLLGLWGYLGLALGGQLAELKFLHIGGWLFVAEPQCEGLAALLLNGNMTADEVNAARTDAYNAALAAQLGLALTVTPTAVDHVEREKPWMRGGVILEGAVGMDIFGQRDTDAFYGVTAQDPRPLAFPYVGTALMVAASDRWQAGLGYEPYVGKSLLISSPWGTIDEWYPTVAGVLGRVRRSWAAGRTLTLALTGGAGMYWLSTANAVLGNPYRSGDLTGSAAGGELELSLERTLSRTAGMSLGIGYRYAVIPRVTLKGQGRITNSDGTPLGVNDAGPFLTTTYKYYFGTTGR